jgi:hypothetical protein
VPASRTGTDRTCHTLAAFSFDLSALDQSTPAFRTGLTTTLGFGTAYAITWLSV